MMILLPSRRLRIPSSIRHSESCQSSKPPIHAAGENRNGELHTGGSLMMS